ncbi:MAG: hypothetical protein ACRDV9_06035, partial [Acidimicrobiia bacterium]
MIDVGPLVPRQLWGWSVAGRLHKTHWRSIREDVVRRARWRCDGCGAERLKGLHADEVWTYDEDPALAILTAIRPLCQVCHMVKHLGRTEKLGRRDVAMWHAMRVNQWTQAQWELTCIRVHAEWRQRERIQWRVAVDADLVER